MNSEETGMSADCLDWSKLCLECFGKRLKDKAEKIGVSQRSEFQTNFKDSV